jgi:hypothetical protein
MYTKFLHRTFCLAFFLSAISRLSAQVVEIYDYELEKKPNLILQFGTNTELGNGFIKSFLVSAETSIGAFNNVGIQYNSIFPSFSNTQDAIEKNGYEFGVFTKYFPHGHLTRKRSNYFFGVDLRKGAFSKSGRTDIYDPSSTYYTSNYKSTKVMVKMGLQWRIKFIVFEISLPMGINWLSYNTQYANSSNTDNYNSDTNFSIIPTFQFGIKL